MFETIIGLETHFHLHTKTKMFCACRNIFGSEANTECCPTCLGLPGALPVINRHAVELAVRAGLVTNCDIVERSVFARKSIVYPDMPKGYQITQFEIPVCLNGRFKINIDNGEREVRINRIHLEDDAGKMIHDQDVDSLVDLNRSGAPLIEIVTEPDFRTIDEVIGYLTRLRRALMYAGVTDGRMEQASMRCDVNISHRQIGDKNFGVRTELKNMNSFAEIQGAMRCEIERQKLMLHNGETLLRETIQWDEKTDTISSLRSKELAHDYRYFPEPDLPPLVVETSLIKIIMESLPENPDARFLRYTEDYQLLPETASVLLQEKAVADYFEEVIAHGSDPKTSANWITVEMLSLCKSEDLNKSLVTPQRLHTILELQKNSRISGNAAKQLLRRVAQSGDEPDALLTHMDLEQVSDSTLLEAVIDQILNRNQAEVQRFRGGESKLMAFFVGQAMKETKGKGNPKELNRLLISKLDMN